jgi:hypothetical protein
MVNSPKIIANICKNEDTKILYIRGKWILEKIVTEVAPSILAASVITDGKAFTGWYINEKASGILSRTYPKTSSRGYGTSQEMCRYKRAIDMKAGDIPRHERIIISENLEETRNITYATTVHIKAVINETEEELINEALIPYLAFTGPEKRFIRPDRSNLEA